MKLLVIIILGILIVGTIGIYYSKGSDNHGFFEENNIEDTTPIGRDLEGYWVYQTRENTIAKTLDYPITAEGIKYAKLVGVSK